MTRLIAPDPDRFEDWRDLILDSGDAVPHGSGMWWVEAGATPDGFEEHLAVSARNADISIAAPEGRVHCTQFWVADDAGALVGFLHLRHELTDSLLARGGHIGYSIRESRRREGHATRALALALDEARSRGIDRALVTCDETNTASARTIESQGGALEDTRDGVRRYWITLPAAG